jgi:hypothetical protein
VCVCVLREPLPGAEMNACLHLACPRQLHKVESPPCVSVLFWARHIIVWIFHADASMHVYVCMHACMHVWMYSCMCLRMYTCMCVFMHAYLYTIIWKQNHTCTSYIHTYMHAYIHTYRPTMRTSAAFLGVLILIFCAQKSHGSVSSCVCVRVCMYVCMYVWICVYLRVYLFACNSHILCMCVCDVCVWLCVRMHIY